MGQNRLMSIAKTPKLRIRDVMSQWTRNPPFTATKPASLPQPKAKGNKNRIPTLQKVRLLI
jgi:hypothetical protein